MSSFLYLPSDPSSSTSTNQSSFSKPNIFGPSGTLTLTPNSNKSNSSVSLTNVTVSTSVNSKTKVIENQTITLKRHASSSFTNDQYRGNGNGDGVKKNHYSKNFPNLAKSSPGLAHTNTSRRLPKKYGALGNLNNGSNHRNIKINFNTTRNSSFKLNAIEIGSLATNNSRFDGKFHDNLSNWDYANQVTKHQILPSNGSSNFSNYSNEKDDPCESPSNERFSLSSFPPIPPPSTTTSTTITNVDGRKNTEKNKKGYLMNPFFGGKIMNNNLNSGSINSNNNNGEKMTTSDLKYSNSLRVNNHFNNDNMSIISDTDSFIFDSNRNDISPVKKYGAGMKNDYGNEENIDPNHLSKFQVPNGKFEFQYLIHQKIVNNIKKFSSDYCSNIIGGTLPFKASNDNQQAPQQPTITVNEDSPSTELFSNGNTLPERSDDQCKPTNNNNNNNNNSDDDGIRFNPNDSFDGHGEDTDSEGESVENNGSNFDEKSEYFHFKPFEEFDNGFAGTGNVKNCISSNDVNNNNKNNNNNNKNKNNNDDDDDININNTIPNENHDINSDESNDRPASGLDSNNNSMASASAIAMANNEAVIRESVSSSLFDRQSGNLDATAQLENDGDTIIFGEDGGALS